MAGRLYLVPNLLGVVPPERVLPAHTIEIARGLTRYVVENAKPARAFLQTLAPKLPIREIAIVELGAVAVCYALGPVILARRLSGLPAVGVMSLSLSVTCVVYIPFAALQWPTAVPSPAVIGSIATLAIVCTAIGTSVGPETSQK